MNRNERLIMLTLLQAAMARGWKLVSIHDGEEEHRGLTLEGAFELANNLEECHWHFRLPKEKHPEGHVGRGWVYTIFANGNDGLDVISDYTVNLDSFYELVDNETPKQPRPHGFMGDVDEFRDELERYWIGDQAYKPDANKAYLERDLAELMAMRAFGDLRMLVREHGQRGGEADELLPPLQQGVEICTAMQILAMVEPRL